jgi:hypothetical protein
LNDVIITGAAWRTNDQPFSESVSLAFAKVDL